MRRQRWILETNCESKSDDVSFIYSWKRNAGGSDGIRALEGDRRSDMEIIAPRPNSP